LQQSALDPVDTFSSPEKQYLLLKMMLIIYQKGAELVELGVPVQELMELPMLTKAKRAKQNFNSEQTEKLRELNEEFIQAFEEVRMEYAKFKEYSQ